MATLKVLKCIPEDRGNSFNTYVYPKWKGEPIPIECEDWKPEPECGNGFHGITKDINNCYIFDYGPIFQVMDVDDNPDNFIEIDGKIKFHKGTIIYQGKDAYTALKMVFGSDEEIIKWAGYTIEYIPKEKQTERLQLIAVKRNSHALKYCHNPTYKVMYEAVKKFGFPIRFIPKEKRTEEIQLLAVKNYCHALEYCHNPTYKVMCHAVKHFGYAIHYIAPENQTEELQLLAVKNHPYAIDYCHKPSEKVKQLHYKLWKQ